MITVHSVQCWLTHAVSYFFNTFNYICFLEDGKMYGVERGASKSFAGGGDGALNKGTQRSHRVLAARPLQ